MKDLFRDGLKGPLKEDDLYENVNSLDSTFLTDKFGALWDDELQRKKPSVIRMIFRAYGAVFIPLCILYSSLESTTKYVNYIITYNSLI